jgi:hypothetical protein
MRGLLQDRPALARMAAKAIEFSGSHSGASQRVMAIIEAALKA